MGAPLTPPDPAREEAELRDYLGPAYDRRRLEGHLALLEAERGSAPSEADLYRTSEAYLYDLTVFAMSQTKEPYLALLAEAVAPGARLLDFGCGIGSDGLRLLEAGYAVEFADFDNPSTRYLRWRLARRGLHAPVHDLDAGDPPGGFDLAYAFDVLEHVDDPEATLAALEERARLVLVNLLERAPDDTPLHHDVPVSRLLRRATRLGLVRYARLHGGRSHLVLYGRGAAGPVRSRGARWRGVLSPAR